MTKQLSRAQINVFENDGFVFPVPVLSGDQAQDYLQRLYAFEAAHPGMSRDEVHHKLLRFKPHVLLPWINELVRHEKILDAVEDLIGPDILCWSSSFFVKAPADPGYISWHQDSATYDLEGGPLITAWIALTDARSDNGAMRFIPASHRLGEQPHTDTWAENNRLSRGEVVDYQVDESTAVDICLAAGQMSLHHIHAIHSSAANHTQRPRIGYAIRYCPPQLRFRGKARESAMLMRGEDRYHHFELEPRPEPGREAAAHSAYQRAIKVRSMTTFRDAETGRALHGADT